MAPGGNPYKQKAGAHRVAEEQTSAVNPHMRQFGHEACWTVNPEKHQKCTKCCFCKAAK